DRQLRRGTAPVRVGQVLAVQPAWRTAHAGRGDRAVRLLDAERGARPPWLVPVYGAGQGGAEPDRTEVAVPRLLRRVRDQGAAVAIPYLAARRGHRRTAWRRRAPRRRAGQGRHVRNDQVLP